MVEKVVEKVEEKLEQKQEVKDCGDEYCGVHTLKELSTKPYP